jgi:heterotetrameric sarcosine oxidase delta subunit
MLLISCPYCGPRSLREFSYGGEAHIARPKQPEAQSDDAWAEYLFMRTNPKGLHLERWCHSHGCRRWFNAARHTVSDQILATYPMGSPPPKLDVPTVGPTPEAEARPELRIATEAADPPPAVPKTAAKKKTTAKKSAAKKAAKKKTATKRSTTKTKRAKTAPKDEAT